MKIFEMIPLEDTVRVDQCIMLSDSGNIKSEVDSMSKETVSDFFPSKFLRASDIETDKVVTIVKVEETLVGDDTKPVITIEEFDKGFVANKTNMNMIASILNSERIADWVGKKIVLFKTTVPFQGVIKDAIRVKAAGSAPAAKSLSAQGVGEASP